MTTVKVTVTAPRSDSPIPFNPFVHFVLDCYFESKDGSILLSSQLMSSQEIDESADYLIEVINKARKQAKDRLHKANEKLWKKLNNESTPPSAQP